MTGDVRQPVPPKPGGAGAAMPPAVQIGGKACTSKPRRRGNTRVPAWSTIGGRLQRISFQRRPYFLNFTTMPYHGRDSRPGQAKVSTKPGEKS
ncbi:hypothetical protein PM3016_5857 [Paenibacillus mucilaginosus 3016]|uniref:Uncharacterized protein n=1 Tax=Paenibacillus mucilaginosus 3016 TaxID=1116391 RepID=H6NNE8_9BACL|nr:hypothetical protein PM3016_5857 [Paenibacillus mucilaginosus 3016]